MSIQPIISFVVLCSILVHGLSIPFFSLGKRVHSVSRTWSRHSGGPDWTTLTRRVSKAEDIVINRDPRNLHDVMERGEATPTATIHEKDGIVSVQGQPVVEKPAGVEDEVGGPTPVRSRRGSDIGEATMRREGSGTITEWREGPHRVIERRTSSTGEVCIPPLCRPVSNTNDLLFHAGRGRGPSKCLRPRTRGADDLPICRQRHRSQERRQRLSSMAEGGYPQAR